MNWYLITSTALFSVAVAMGIYFEILDWTSVFVGFAAGMLITRIEDGIYKRK